jgi:hypothetical protein
VESLSPPIHHTRVRASWLKRESRRLRKQRRNLKQFYLDLMVLVYAESYHLVAAFARDWRQREREAAQQAVRGTYVPLQFAPGEDFQFDWSEDWVRLGPRPVKLKVDPPPSSLATGLPALMMARIRMFASLLVLPPRCVATTKLHNL